MNLLMTGNLSSIDAYALETWGNEALIAINQDPLGSPAILLDDNAGVDDKMQSSSEVRIAWKRRCLHRVYL